MALDGYVVAPMRIPAIKEDMGKDVYWQERRRDQKSLIEIRYVNFEWFNGLAGLEAASINSLSNGRGY